MTGRSYDLLVIGSGPAGQAGAIAAAGLGKRVAIVERKRGAGGAGLHEGMIPSRALRAAILQSRDGPASRATTPPGTLSLGSLAERVRLVAREEQRIAREELRRSDVEAFEGHAGFLDPGTVEVTTAAREVLRLCADRVLVACGSRPSSSPDLPIDGVRTFSAHDLLRLESLPGELLVVGAGLVGLEIASMLSTLGIPVTVVEQSASMLPFVDREIVEALATALRRRGTAFRFGERVTRLTVLRDGRVRASIDGGRPLDAEAILLAVGRQGNGDLLGVENAGLKTDARGRLAVDRDFRTAVPHILAAGDVIGFPSLASTSAEQGRIAVERAFGREAPLRPECLPAGIYTIPEVAMVGRTEEQLAAELVPYEVGLAHFEELPRGRLLGEAEGTLKILFDRWDRRLLGIHIVGEGATELIHVGQTALALGGTIDTFADAVFNTPTFAEAYKKAARNGLNRL